MQVSQHLQSHLSLLPGADEKSRAVVAQMAVDETAHAELAQVLGAAQLPSPLSGLMRKVSSVMTSLSYRI